MAVWLGGVERPYRPLRTAHHQIVQNKHGHLSRGSHVFQFIT